MAELSEVKLWAQWRGKGKGHVVMLTQGEAWVHTLCGSLGNFTTTTERPKTICKVCRENLKKATVRKKENDDANQR